MAGDTLVCAHHGWEYDCRSGHSKIDNEEALQDNEEALQPFEAWRDGDAAWIDAAAVRSWRARTPMDF